MIILTKFIALLFGFIVIGKSYNDLRKRQESLTMFLFWFIVWFTIIVFAVFPRLIDEIGGIIGKSGSNVNNFLGVAFVFLFFITYRIYIKANRIEQKLNKLITNAAIGRIKRW